jgi:thermopsin
VYRSSTGRIGAALLLAALVAPGALGAPHAPAASHGAIEVFGQGGSSAPDPPPPSSSLSARIAALEGGVHATGVPVGLFHPPDLAAADPGRVGPVSPTYTTGPAPMGLSDLGLRNVSGTLTPYVLDTSSVYGSVALTRAESVYVDGDGPDTFGIQLNAVAPNVTLFGRGGYEFWAQNFVIYTPSTGNLSFGDNVWNFSSAQGAISSNVFAATGPNGTLDAPYLYYATGPTLSVAYPFTLDLYLNATDVGGRPAIYFNYSVAASNGPFAGSFDHVVFNSVAGSAGKPASPPIFQVNGTAVDPFGLPNDFELDVVGNGDGDTTTFFAMNATLALKFWNGTAGAYQVVPSAYDAGSDTGETSNGILPIYHTPLLPGPPTVTVGTGPSYVLGLWNVSTELDGSRNFSVSQKPQNAFLFASPGTTFNASTAQWVPTVRLGATASDFALPNAGNFSLQWMLSDRTPDNYSVTNLLPLPGSNTSLTVNLTVDDPLGSYTPLFAWKNAELSAIGGASGSGTGALGSSTNPYILVHRPVGGLNPVFGQVNDFGFPVFAGVLLIDTTDYVHVMDPPVSVAYGTWEDPTLDLLGLPHNNSLQLEFWNVSNVVVTNSSDLSGWLPASVYPFPAAEVEFWGSDDNLVASNTFYDQGYAVSLFGGKNNTVWGNTILVGATDPALDGGNATVGLLESESGDLLYNNYVDVSVPALTPTVNAFSCQVTCLPASYVDVWNVSRLPANATTTVDAVPLSGSILHLSYQGGNFWSNYGTAADPFGVLPYDDAGAITTGGDYLPLYPASLYPVTFVQTGLASGLLWGESSLGVLTTSASSDLEVFAPNGTYGFSISAPAGYLAPSPGSFVVNGSGLSIPLVFDEEFTEEVGEAGLVSGWTWSVSFEPDAGSGGSGITVNSTSAGLSAVLTNGTFSYAVTAYGYRAIPSSGLVTIHGPPATLNVRFALVPILTVTASGLARGVPWSVTVVQGSSTVTETGVGNDALVFTVLQLAPGPFSWTVTAANYTASPGTGTGTAPTASSAGVTFTSTSPSAAPSSFVWWPYALAALAVLAIIGFVLYARERRRPRGPPPPIAPIVPAGVAKAAAPPAPAPAPAPSAPTPSSPAAWEEGPADTSRPAPWEEGPDDADRSGPRSP